MYLQMDCKLKSHVGVNERNVPCLPSKNMLVYMLAPVGGNYLHGKHHATSLLMQRIIRSPSDAAIKAFGLARPFTT
jgi:hypothetical protein